MHWVVATKRPNTFSMASEISPTVARARTAGCRLPAGCRTFSAAWVTPFQGAARGRIVTIGFELLDHAGIWSLRTSSETSSTSIGIFIELVFVHADDDIQPLVDAGLAAGRRLFDTHLGMPVSMALAMPPSC
jgi:hypothetical protein